MLWDFYLFLLLASMLLYLVTVLKGLYYITDDAYEFFLQFFIYLHFFFILFLDRIPKTRREIYYRYYIQQNTNTGDNIQL